MRCGNASGGVAGDRGVVGAPARSENSGGEVVDGGVGCRRGGGDVEAVVVDFRGDGEVAAARSISPSPPRAPPRKGSRGDEVPLVANAHTYEAGCEAHLCTAPLRAAIWPRVVRRICKKGEPKNRRMKNSKTLIEID